MFKPIAVALCLSAAVVQATATADEPVTTGTLLAELSNLDHLAEFPGPGVKVVQFSSYDRRSKIPGGPDWFGNSDGFGGEPIPNFEGVVKPPGADGVGEYLICDVKQPGAIVRTWTAAIAGTIRLSFDGAEKPVYDGPAQDFFMHRATAFAKASGADPAGAVASEQRYADYYPMPFTKSCRIVWVGKLTDVHFYHVQLRLYPAGTAVQTFTREDAAKNTAVAAAQAAKLNPPPQPLSDAPAEAVLEPGQGKELVKHAGPGRIVELRARVRAPDMTAALRGVLLKISFDGFQSPQVLCPIGDFFGASPGVVPYQSLPMTVTPDGWMFCRFVMPFEKEAVISVENRSAGKATVDLAAMKREYSWSDRSMHFRTSWRADHDLTAKGGKDAVDLPFLVAQGEGVYVGTAVYVVSPCPVPTAGGNWWGEGDEKVFVDGEKRPSIFGTGSEDYFNYAWSESDIFQYPYFAQPICTGPETRGYITNNRWHVIDAIPFEKSIAFYMELFSHTGTPHLSYTRVAYYYAKPGVVHDTPAINGSSLTVPPLAPWTVRAAGGASGATIFEAEDCMHNPNKNGPSGLLESSRYSAGKLAWFQAPWTAEFKVKTEKEGKHQIILTCASGPSKATFTATIDGKPLLQGKTDKIDLFTPYFDRLVNVRFDPLELPAGEHIVSLRQERKGKVDEDAMALAGANFTWIPGVGVDFIWVKPMK